MHVAFEGRILLRLELTRHEDSPLSSAEVAVEAQQLFPHARSFLCESVSRQLVLSEGKRNKRRPVRDTASLAELAKSLGCI